MKINFIKVICQVHFVTIAIVINHCFYRCSYCRHVGCRRSCGRYYLIYHDRLLCLFRGCEKWGLRGLRALRWVWACGCCAESARSIRCLLGLTKSTWRGLSDISLPCPCPPLPSPAVPYPFPPYPLPWPYPRPTPQTNPTAPQLQSFEIGAPAHLRSDAAGSHLPQSGTWLLPACGLHRWLCR